MLISTGLDGFEPEIFISKRRDLIGFATTDYLQPNKMPNYPVDWSVTGRCSEEINVCDILCPNKRMFCVCPTWMFSLSLELELAETSDRNVHRLTSGNHNKAHNPSLGFNAVINAAKLFRFWTWCLKSCPLGNPGSPLTKIRKQSARNSKPTNIPKIADVYKSSGPRLDHSYFRRSFLNDGFVNQTQSTIRVSDRFDHQWTGYGQP